MRNYVNEPLELPCGVVIPNRLAKASMTEGLADAGNGPTQSHVRLYRRWAQGGIGLSLTGNVMVDRQHLERPGNVAITSRTVPALMREWAQAGASAMGQVWMQIGHAGRQTPRFINPAPKSSSVTQLALAGQFGAAQAYSSGEIGQLVDRFADAAWVARQAGFTGVQIHAAHGFLLSEFLSPVLNQRTDRWGGSLDNRARLLLAIVDAVRSTVGPHYPVSVKLNSDDFQKGGFSIDECLTVVKWLGDRRIDLLEVSGGSYEQPRMVGHRSIAPECAHPAGVAASARSARREAYFIDYAKRLRQAANVSLMVTGGFRTLGFMQETLRNKELDMIGLARPLVIDPDLPRKLLTGQAESAAAIEKTLVINMAHLGPASAFMIWRLINIQGQQSWFYHQIKRLGKGLEADLSVGLLRGLISTQFSERIAAFRLAP